MQLAWVIVTIKQTSSYTRKLIKEIKSLKRSNIRIYKIENIEGKEGYAKGINKGLRQALLDGATHFIISNPDISIKSLDSTRLLDVAKYFDVWGYAHVQDEKRYYGGIIDKWRLSGGLNDKKPSHRFTPVDFVSGSLIGFSKKVVGEIGYWDEGYGMYYEEVDYCTRAKRAGLRVGIDKQLFYMHFEQSKESKLKNTLLATSRLKYFWKYSSIFQKMREAVRAPKTIYEHRSLIWSAIVRRSFLVDFLSLNSSSLVNKVLNFILFAFLIRYVTSKEYGMYNLVWAHIGLLAPLADFGTTNYGILYHKKGSHVTFAQFFYFRILLSLIVVLITYTLTFVLGFENEVRFLILLTLPVILANAMSGSLLISLSRQKRSYITSIISMGFNSLLVISSIALILTTYSIKWIFVGIGALYMLYGLLNSYILSRFEKISSPAFPSYTSITSIVRNSYMFILLGFFAGLYFKADVYLLNLFKGLSTVGVYSAGYKFYEALMFIVGSYSIAAAARLRGALANHKSTFRTRILKDGVLMFTIGMLIASLGAILSPRIFPYFLQGEYMGGIRVFQIVIFALPFLLASNVFMNGLYLIKKTHLVVYVFVVQLILNIALNVIFIPTYSYIASSYITVMGEICNMLLVVYLFHKSYANYA